MAQNDTVLGYDGTTIGTPSGGGSSMADTQTVISQPWAPQGNALADLYNRTGNVLQNTLSQAGSYDPFGATTKSALSQLATTAGSNPFLGTMSDTFSGVASGQNGINTGSMFGDIYNQTQQPGSLSGGFFGDVASGSMVGNNPYSEDALTRALDETQARTKAGLSAAGRYGSNLYGEAMGNALGGVAADFRFNQYNQDVQNALAAAQARSGENLGLMQTGLSAASGATGVQNQNIANQMNAAGQLPSVYDFSFAAPRQLAQVGAAQDAQQAQIDSRGRDLLGWANSIFGTVPGAAGTSTQSQPQQKSSWLDYLGLGGALLGGIASIFG